MLSGCGINDAVSQGQLEFERAECRVDRQRAIQGYDSPLVHVSHGAQCRRFVKISMHEFEHLVQRYAGYEQVRQVFDFLVRGAQQITGG